MSFYLGTPELIPGTLWPCGSGNICVDPIVFIHCRSFSDGKLTERPPVRRLHKNESSGPQVFHHPFRVLASYLSSKVLGRFKTEDLFANIFKSHHLYNSLFSLDLKREKKSVMHFQLQMSHLYKNKTAV